MDRRKARKEAFCAIYEYYFNNGEVAVEDIIRREQAERGIEKDEYLDAVCLGVVNNTEKLDAIIEKYLKGWKMRRISKVSLSILRLAVYELACMEAIPVNVSANEAVELAKLYDDDAAPAFINGVLGAYLRELEAAEQ